jgi:hypothetical protein
VFLQDAESYLISRKKFAILSLLLQAMQERLEGAWSIGAKGARPEI